MEGTVTSGPAYRLYKARFTGLLGVVILSIVSGLSLDWFGPVANDSKLPFKASSRCNRISFLTFMPFAASEDFGISLDEVNWLGTIISCTYVVTAPFVPLFCSRYGLRSSVSLISQECVWCSPAPLRSCCNSRRDA